MTTIRKPDATTDGMHAYRRSSQSTSSVDRVNGLRGRITGGAFGRRESSLTAQRVTFGRSLLALATFERDPIKRSPPATDCEIGPRGIEERSIACIGHEAIGMFNIRNPGSGCRPEPPMSPFPEDGEPFPGKPRPWSTGSLAFGVLSPFFELHVGPEAHAERIMREMREREKNEPC